MTGEPAPIPATAPEMPEAQEQPGSRSRIKDAVIEIVTTVGLAVILYLIITTFIVQTFRVEQHSMQNSLQPGEHLLIDKITPRFDDYSRGDIIVFHPNGATDETPYIKRVIGVGGIGRGQGHVRDAAAPARAGADHGTPHARAAFEAADRLGIYQNDLPRGHVIVEQLRV